MKSMPLATISQENPTEGYWGYHLILDCQGCLREKISDGDHIRTFAKALVARIEMKAFGEPLVQHFAAHEPTVGGYSLVQLIETSSITGHFVDQNGDAYLDIFSCQRFDIAKAQAVVQEFFKPQKIKLTYLTRQA